MVIRPHILDEPELGVDVVLHFILVSIEVIRRDVQQDANLRAERGRAIQLETADFNDIPIMLFHGHLSSQTFAHIAGQGHVKSTRFHEVVCQQGGGRFSVRAGDGDYFTLGIPVTKFQLINDFNGAGFGLFYYFSLVGNPRAFDDKIGFKNFID